MAKKSKIARNEQRKVIVDRYAVKRAELKKTLVDENATDEAREAARVGLQKLPRNASPVRVRYRDMAHRGELPGITKSSW
jgi:small subunit ribosomal protein S14